MLISGSFLIPPVKYLSEVNLKFYYEIFNFFPIFAAIPPPYQNLEQSEKVIYIQKYLKILSDSLGVSLDYIKPGAIVNRDLLANFNLLELLSVLIVNQEDSIQKPQEVKEDKVTQTEITANFPTFVKTTFGSNNLKSKPSLSSTSSSCSCPISLSSSFTPCSCPDEENTQKRSELIKNNNLIKEQIILKRQPTYVINEDQPEEKRSIDELKELHKDNFALKLGYRLHEALNLQDKTEKLEENIRKLEGRPLISKPKPKAYLKKYQTKNKNTLIKKKNIIPKRNSVNKNALKPTSVNLQKMLEKYDNISLETVSYLRKQEKNQHKYMKSVLSDLATEEVRKTKQLEDALEKQRKKSQIIRKDIIHLQKYSEAQALKTEKAKLLAAQRDTRIEQIRLKKDVEEFHRSQLSKFEATRSKEEKLLKDDFARKCKEAKEDILDFRKRIKEEHENEKRKQNLMLEALQTL